MADALTAAGLVATHREHQIHAHCPAHEDGRASLSVTWRVDSRSGAGRTFVDCHGGCDGLAVVQALGFAGFSDLYDAPPALPADPARRRPRSARSQPPAAAARTAPPRAAAAGKPKAAPKKKARRLVETYPYQDVHGGLVYEVTRWEPKEFTLRTVDASGRRQPRWPAVDRRVLYRLPGVAAAIAAGELVWVAEGEKDADALAAAGVAATCNAGGAAVGNDADTRWLPQYTAALAGAHVVLVADRDGPEKKQGAYAGYRHVLHLLEQVHEVAASVRVVQACEGKDATDHLAAGHGVEEFTELDPAALRALLDPSGPAPAPEEEAPAGQTAPELDDVDETPPSASLPAGEAVSLDETAAAAPAQDPSPGAEPAADGPGEPGAAEGLDPVDLDSERRRRRGRGGGEGEGASVPGYPVNVTFGLGYRYSLGFDDYDRGVYEYKRDGSSSGQWVRRCAMPIAHARVVRRDGTRRRVGTEYLLSMTEDSDRVVVTNDELADGRWAVKLGANLSGDRNIITAVETAIRDHAHRHAPEREATARPQAHTETGHVDIPVAECMPNGYLTLPPHTDPGAAREVMGEVVEIVARHPKMALTMGASAGGPFVGPMRRQSHWWDLYGDSRKGKSTTQAVAASLWGDPRLGDGIVLGWDATSVGTGRFLGQLGILPPFFDERGLASFDKPRWGEVVYSTCQGSSRLKAEADSAQGTHKSVPWFGVLFSTGNDRLTDGIAAGRFAGIPARVVELAAPFTENATEAKILDALVARCYGWLGPAVLETNTVPGVEALIARAEALVGTPPGGGVPGTIAEHLHMAVAGAMMIDAQVGTGEVLTTAAVEAAREHLDANAHEPKHDADRMVDALSESLVSRRSAWPTLAEYGELSHPRRSWDPDAQDRRVSLPQHGFDQQINGIRSDDGKWLYVLPSVWRQLADELGLDSAVACAKLYDRGHLHVSSARKRAGEWQASPRMNGKPVRCYQLSLFAFDLGDDSDPASSTTPDEGPSTGGAAALPVEAEQAALPVNVAPEAGPESDAAAPTDSAGDQASETVADPSAAPQGCVACPSEGQWCGFGSTTEQQAPCVSCGRPTGVRSACGAARHPRCEALITGETSEPGEEAAPPVPVRPPPPARRSPSPRAQSRQARQDELLEMSKAELGKGADDGALRLLAALEGEYAPMRRGGTENRLRPPFWRPELPGCTFAAHVISSWSWSRPHTGPTAVLDRSGAFVAAASSVLVAHGELMHTGEIEFDDRRPGYYQVQVHPWHFANEAPHPLSGAHRQQTAWVPAPTVALLRDLAEQGRWGDVTVLDSYTAEGVRLEKWAGFVNKLRAEAINSYGRDSEQYVMVKEAFGMALSLMLGSPGDSGTSRRWHSAAQRPDWTHAVQAQASATIYRWAEDCRKMAPELGPVALRNVDELVLPAEAMDIVTTQQRPGGRSPMTIDPDGIKLGSFKMKQQPSGEA